MIQSAVDVVNLALVKLGSQLVTNLNSPSTPLEKRAALVYPHLRDSELSQRRWRFALRRARMQAIPTADVTGPTIDSTLVTLDMTLDEALTDLLPPDGLFYAKLPDNCLRPLRDESSCWEEEGRYLLTPENGPFRLLYIARVGEDQFAPTFAEALSAKVAEQLAEFLTQSNEKKDRATAMYGDAIKAARLINAYDTGAETIYADDSNCAFLTGRYGYGDEWGVTSALGAYAGVRGDLAAVSPGVAPNPIPSTVSVGNDVQQQGGTVYINVPYAVNAPLTADTLAALLRSLPTYPPSTPGQPWNNGGELAFTPL
jgi:hypothetical protein